MSLHYFIELLLRNITTLFWNKLYKLVNLFKIKITFNIFLNVSSFYRY